VAGAGDQRERGEATLLRAQQTENVYEKAIATRRGTEVKLDD
jgi:hypothetical protein